MNESKIEALLDRLADRQPAGPGSDFTDGVIGRLPVRQDRVPTAALAMAAAIMMVLGGAVAMGVAESHRHHSDQAIPPTLAIFNGAELSGLR